MRGQAGAAGQDDLADGAAVFLSVKTHGPGHLPDEFGHGFLQDGEDPPFADRPVQAGLTLEKLSLVRRQAELALEYRGEMFAADDDLGIQTDAAAVIDGQDGQLGADVGDEHRFGFVGLDDGPGQRQ